MDDADIEYLRLCLIGKLFVWWNDAHKGWRKIATIGNMPDEEVPVAFLEDRSGHVALAACVTEDFMVTTWDIAQWPSKQ